MNIQYKKIGNTKECGGSHWEKPIKNLNKKGTQDLV